MAKLYYGTDRVSEDEPCLSLFELNLPCPKGGTHRYQIINVIRNGHPSEFRHDMGSVKKFKGADQLRIPGGVIDNSSGEKRIFVEHNVGELIEIANQLRDKPAFDKRELVGLNNIRMG